MIDWSNFTPMHALLGGGLIGSAAAVLMLLDGRIAGISGIVGGLLLGANGDRAWRLYFLAGLVLAPLCARLIFGATPSFQLDAPWPLLIGAGLLVGCGTTLGSGCTSGHGVCGLARLSLRSLIAVLTFMGAGMTVVALIRHGIGG